MCPADLERLAVVGHHREAREVQHDPHHVLALAADAAEPAGRLGQLARGHEHDHGRLDQPERGDDVGERAVVPPLIHGDVLQVPAARGDLHLLEGEADQLAAHAADDRLLNNLKDLAPPQRRTEPGHDAADRLVKCGHWCLLRLFT